MVRAYKRYGVGHWNLDLKSMDANSRKEKDFKVEDFRMPGLSGKKIDETYDIDPYGHATRSELILASCSFITLILVSVFVFMPELASFIFDYFRQVLS